MDQQLFQKPRPISPVCFSPASIKPYYPGLAATRVAMGLVGSSI